MRTAIITGWTGNLFAKMACHTVPLIEAYATRHGAMFACVNVSGNRPASWMKVHCLVQGLQQFDRVAWIDSDVVIERPYVSIFDQLSDEHWQGLVEHQTNWGAIPNCGIWVVGRQMLPILEEIWNSGKYIDHPWWEQACMLEKMGYNVAHPNATLIEPTDLYHRTAWLDPTWNHHPDDHRRVPAPNFRHITRYPDRLEATIFFAAKAEAVFPPSDRKSQLAEALFNKNLNCLLPAGELRQHTQQAHARPENTPFAQTEPLMIWGEPACDLHSMDAEMKMLAAKVEAMHGGNVCLFGAGQLLPYLRFSEKSISVYEPDPRLLSLCLSKIDFEGTRITFCASLDELLQRHPEMLLVYSPYRELFAEHYRKIEAYGEAHAKSASTIKARQPQSSQLRILVQARENIFQSLGGDTVALERSTDALRRLGVSAVIDPLGKEDPRNFDLVHLYNFATPEQIEPFGRRARERDVPFVVTSLHEDLPGFFSKMCLYGQVMSRYFMGEFPGTPFGMIREAVQAALPNFKETIIRNNDFLAKNAAALLSSGEAESQLLRRDFPFAKAIKAVHFGCQTRPDIPASLFCDKFQMQDYVLCVGRIEWRKNQAMLLKALEDSDLPVVLVAGNMTYQPEYQQAVMQFRRKGKTAVVVNLSAEELSSAYRGARAHVLPSWFELPGLVSLEAARLGTPVVGSTMGSLPDYLGSEADYCDPESIESIRAAVETAVQKPRGRQQLIDTVQEYTWDNTAKNLIAIYSAVLDGSLAAVSPSPAAESLNAFAAPA